MKLVHKLFLKVCTLLLVTSCFLNSSKRTITAKLNRDTTFVLKKHENQEHIWGMTIRIKANFKDSIAVSFGPAYKHILIGQIDTILKVDWYGDDCRLKFEKLGSLAEDLLIEYDFFD